MRQFSNMSQQVLKETIKAGTVIFRQGDSESHFYIIEEGRVGIFIDKDGKVTKVQIKDSMLGGSEIEACLTGALEQMAVPASATS